LIGGELSLRLHHAVQWLVVMQQPRRESRQEWL
jgi:hypothetical protein